jgi:Sec-independent protein translocase protein TatA
MLRTILMLLGLYLLYKLIFEFIVPIYKTTKQVKQKVGEMQQKMHEQMQEQQNGYKTTKPDEAPKKPKRDDYIEFEEVKKA